MYRRTAQSVVYSFDQLKDMILLYREATAQLCHVCTLKGIRNDEGCVRPNVTSAGGPRSHRSANVEYAPCVIEQFPSTSTRPVIATFPSEQGWGCCMINCFILSVYNMCKLCSCCCIMNIGMHSAAGCIISNLFQPSFTSYGMRFWILVTSTHGLITANFPFNKRFQQQFIIFVNVWEGIIGDLFQGSYKFPHPLLTVSIWTITATSGWCTVSKVWVLHDGAPAHSSCHVMWCLDSCYPGQWMGQNKPVLWPQRSPDLTPADFYLWGHVKNMVYAQWCNTWDKLWNATEAAATKVRNMPDVFQLTRNSSHDRAKLCIGCNDVPFRHTL
jgi:hypothetical protein